MEGPSRRRTRTAADPSLRNYKILWHLRDGAFGEVMEASHNLTGLKVAIKILNRQRIRDDQMEDKVEREIKMWKFLEHPHVIRLYEVIKTETDIYEVMELAERGDLFDYIIENGKVEENEARRFFQQIIAGLEYCHQKRVVHRDLKPENLLLDSSGNIKIADFGLSNFMRDGHFLKKCCGSPNYAAPELIAQRLYAGPEVDVWSCGVILYALLSGFLPFMDENIPNLFRKIKGGAYSLPSHLTPGARDLIARMLVVDPLKRITIPEIRQHYWFRENIARYLASPLLAHPLSRINEEILQRVIALGFDRNLLLLSLQNRRQDQGTIAYYILLDNYSATNSYRHVELQTYLELNSPASSIYPSQSVVQHHLTGLTNFPSPSSRPQMTNETRWFLGLQFGLHPHQIMVEVLNTLSQLNVCWKKIGHYNMKCMWSRVPEAHQVASVSFPPPPTQLNTGTRSQTTVKFELQLYKTCTDNYLLDLQIVTGPHLLFLELCASFLTRVQVFWSENSIGGGNCPWSDQLVRIE